MFTKKEIDTKHSLDSLETQVSILDPELYRTTIHALIAEIRQKYNGPELKQLVVNIHRLEEYNMIKLARCNKQLEKHATFSFKLSEIEDLLEKYNTGFLRVLEDSPDYRLDDLYRRFVHINHKIAELDPDHMRIFGGCIKKNTGLPGRIMARSNGKLKAEIDKNNSEYNKLVRILESTEEENSRLKQQIETARMDTQMVIKEIMNFKEVERSYENKIYELETYIYDLNKKIQAKQQIIRQKDQLAENYKNSIEKLKLSLLTPTKLSKSNQKEKNKDRQMQLHQKIGSTVETAIKRVFQHNNTAREPLMFTKEDDRDSPSPGFRSEKGSRTPKLNKTPPRPPAVLRFNNQKSQTTDLWNMLLVQSVSLEQMLMNTQ